MSNQPGNLYVVATPIGNLKDISYRAVETLRQVDVILVEDTRNAAKLMQHYKIIRPLKALHEHNEARLAPGLIQKLISGQNFALISDAGTPLVSDPGFRLVQAAIEAGIQPITIPGACAAIAALSIAGLPTDRFVFEGFLPAKRAARERALQGLKSDPRTLVFYEAKHRIHAFLKSMASVFGANRSAVVARELTKKFESVYHGTLSSILDQIRADEQASKGEFVVMLQGADMAQHEVDIDAVLIPLLSEMSVTKASKLAAKISGVNKNKCYQRALQLQETK